MTINIKLALTIYQSLIRSALTYAASACGHAAKTFLKALQFFQNKVLRIIKLPMVTPAETLHDQTCMESANRHVARTVSKSYFENHFTDNKQIKQLGHFNPTRDKYKMSHGLLTNPTPLW